MSKKQLLINDFFKVSLVNTDKEINDFFSFGSPESRRYRNANLPDKPLPQSLTVKIASTHSSKVTENNTFYLPDKMASGTSSWLKPFAKPILLHHNKEDDAVGRVVEARYVDTSYGHFNNISKPADSIITDSMLDSFIKGNLPHNNMVDVVRDIFLKDQYIKDRNYAGLGYIELTASISDPDTIAKIIDQRFLTGSIGASTDAAVCSICKKDWLTDDSGPCEHEPGQMYDGVLAVIVAGNLTYREYSYVNTPADSHSQTIEIVNKEDDNKQIEMSNNKNNTSTFIISSVEWKDEEQQTTQEEEPIDEWADFQPIDDTDEYGQLYLELLKECKDSTNEEDKLIKQNILEREKILLHLFSFKTPILYENS
jgi:hypothetical protein